MESPGLRVCAVSEYGLHYSGWGEVADMAEQNEEATSVGSPGAVEEVEQLEEITPTLAGLFNHNVMIVHRDGSPLLALLIQEFRMDGYMPLFRIKQEFPDTPNYFPIVTWFNSTDEAEAYAEAWVRENISDLR